MRIIKELKSDNSKKLKHTLVQATDEHFYKILTFKLYEIETGPEFSQYEVNIQQVEQDETFTKLVVPHFRRFMTKQEALDYHQEVLDKFEQLLGIKPKEPAKH